MYVSNVDSLKIFRECLISVIARFAAFTYFNVSKDHSVFELAYSWLVDDVCMLAPLFWPSQWISEEKFVTIQEYQAQNRDEISFEKGVVVEVVQKNLEGWWVVRYV